MSGMKATSIPLKSTEAVVVVEMKKLFYFAMLIDIVQTDTSSASLSNILATKRFDFGHWLCKVARAVASNTSEPGFVYGHQLFYKEHLFSVHC